MKQYEAKKIITEVFESPFNKDKFTYFIRNLLKDLHTAEFLRKGYNIPKAFEEFIASYERLGKYEDEEKNLIDVLIVKLKRDHAIDYARSTQRNFVRWYLNDKGKDAALVAFHTDKTNEWRFSFIKMQYSIDKKKDELTPAKRSSFMIGESGKSHTAQRQLIDLLKNDHAPFLSDIEDAFSIEAVSDEFYEKYKSLLFNLVDEIEKIVKKDKAVKDEFESKNISILNFSKKLLGQIVFLYFLQKKGWLGLLEKGKYGEGDKSFLRSLFNKTKTGENFFNDYLEYLFYDALSKKRVTDYYDRFKTRIPFLNGGLFDPIEFYDWQKTDIVVPNRIFSDRKGDEEGSGILDVFDLYNFTVKEDEPLETEVAIDPEMLGKVFERMLDVTERKSKGAFYTPREIVHYMSQQCLLYFLETELNQTVSYNKLGRKQLELVGNDDKKGQLDLVTENKVCVVPKADLETFIHYGEHIIDKDIAIEEGKLSQTANKQQIPDSIRQHADAIDNALGNIKICDPAVGSGAFPVGIMNEIVKLRKLLTPFLKKESADERSAYRFKSNAIQNSIYGVDIDAGAVEIAKLRLWLSMVVDEERIDNIEPLPNLEYKIVKGNSLINIPFDLARDIKLEDNINKLTKNYYSITDKRKKQEQKEIIDTKIQQLLASASEFAGYDIDFDFKLFFHEVWNEKDGFDVVIGNPPYVRADSGEEYLIFRKILLSSKQYQTLWEKWDLYVAFIEKGYSILKKDGVISYIIPSAYLTAKYALKSRKFFVDNARIDRIDFLMDLDVFDATVKNIIFQYSKINFENHKPIRIKHENNFGNIKILKSDFQSTLKENVFNETLKKAFHFENTIQWGDIFYVSYGLRPNADEKIAKGLFKKSDLISDIKDNIHIKPYIEGKNIKPYKIEKIRYLEWNTERCPSKIARPTFEELYISPKIIQGRMTGAVYDSFGLVSNDSTFISTFWHNLKKIQNRSINNSVAKDFKVKGQTATVKKRKELECESKLFEIKYCLAILNSKFAKWFFNQVRRSAIGLYPDDIKKLPIKSIHFEKQKPLKIIVDYILFLKSQENDTQSLYFEQLIDGMVYELYFENEMKQAGCDILKYLNDLLEIKDEMENEGKMKIITKVFNKLYDKESPVRKNLEAMNRVEEVAIIKKSLEK